MVESYSSGGHKRRMSKQQVKKMIKELKKWYGMVDKIQQRSSKVHKMEQDEADKELVQHLDSLSS
jgi:hypothetical protein